MLNVKTNVIGIVVAIAALGLGMNAASAQMKMKFAAEDKDLYPTYLGSGTDTLAEKPGVTVELIRLVAKDIGVEPVFVRAPWRRSRCRDQRLVQLGTDGIRGVPDARRKA